MAQFEWQQRFDIGVSEMNYEHMKLLTLMDKLEDAFLAQESYDVQKEILESLASYTHTHFADEEAYMLKIGYPNIESHKLIHLDLLEKFKVHIQGFTESRVLKPELFDFLKLWLSSHICGVDMKYGRFNK